MKDKTRLLCVHQSDPACLARYKVERIDGIGADSSAARIGSACHRACEALAYEADGELLRPAQFKVAEQAIEAAARDLGLSPGEQASALAIMERALAPSSRLRFGIPTDWQHAAEHRWALDSRFRPCDPDDPKRLCAGTIDLLEWNEAGGSVRVTDEKTTLGFQSGDDIRHEFQPRLYSLWAGINFGVPTVTFRYRNLRHGYTVSAEFRMDDPWVDATKARVLALRAEREAALEMDAWPATLGSDCAFCPIMHACPEMLAAAKSGRETDVTAPVAARRLMALRALASRYEKTVRLVIETTQAPIPLSAGEVFGMKPVTKWRLVSRFSGEDGSVTPEQREKLMEYLRGFKMTPAQEREWFTFCREGDLSGRVKTALGELLGREAGRFIDDPLVSPIEPCTEFQMSAWVPATGKAARNIDLDEAF